MNEKIFTPLFYFMNEDVALVEIKLNNLDDNASKDQLYHWIKFSNSSQEISRLKFISMGSENINGNNINIRVFEDGELRFDDSFAKFQHKGDGHIIMNAPINTISEVFKNRIEEYISNL
jgi:hypothetical protein